MKRFYFFVTMLAFALLAKAQYQFPNSDFESDFVSAYPSKGYTEPQGWHGYATLDAGIFTSAGRSGSKLVASNDVHEGSTGSHSVCVTATDILSVIANGVMTNGQIYSHSITATNGKSNYNFSDQTNAGNTSTYGDNDQFYTSFTGRPDYMKVWLKFVPAGEDNGNARVSVYLHKDGTVMYDPTDNVADFSIVVAHAEETIPTNDGAWTQYTIPFDYDGEGQYDGSAAPALILATFSTNETPGKGADGDSLYIDDIEMVYLSELKYATYNGEEITFTDGAAKVSIDEDWKYNAELFECVADGVAATIEIDEPTEENGNVLTITVKGDNISADETNYHTYTVQFAATEESEATTKIYTDELVVSVNGETLDPMETSVTVEYLEDGNINFALENFVLEIDGSELAVGNIEVDGIELSDVDGEEYKTFSFDGTIRVTGGDLEGVTMWWGPWLGDVPIVMEGKITDDKLYVTIGIALSSLGMDIDVVFGSDFEAEEPEELTITYTDELVVTVNGETLDPMETSVTVEYLDDGSINFVLNNFVLEIEGSELAVGNIEVDGIELSDVDGEEYKTFSFDGTIRVTRGDLEGVTMWWGPWLGDVPIVMEGKITDDKLYVTIGIALSSLGMDIDVVFGSDFEEYVEPDLTLHATWDGEEIADGAVISGSYDPERLVITESEGTIVVTDYDNEICMLTITITAQNDESNSIVYHITFTTPTGVNDILCTPSNEAIYDLSGRRIAGKSQKGVYVIGGKKVLVK